MVHRSWDHNYSPASSRDLQGAWGSNAPARQPPRTLWHSSTLRMHDAADNRMVLRIRLSGPVSISVSDDGDMTAGSGLSAEIVGVTSTIISKGPASSLPQVCKLPSLARPLRSARGASLRSTPLAPLRGLARSEKVDQLWSKGWSTSEQKSIHLELEILTRFRRFGTFDQHGRTSWSTLERKLINFGAKVGQLRSKSRSTLSLRF